MLSRRMKQYGIAAVALVLVLSGVRVAEASFPGTNGLIAYIQGGNIFLVDPASGSPPLQITLGGNFNNVSYNAAANRLVAEDASGVVFLEPVAGSPVTQLPGGNNNDDDPSFNPDGTRVTFENNNDIFVQDVTGPNRTNITNTAATAEQNPEWSADGTYIAYQNATNFQIQRIAPTGGGLITLTPAAAGCAAATPCQAPTTSPSNLNVAYDQDGAPQGIFQVLSSGASASSLRLSTGNDDFPSYAPAGDRVVFQRNANVTTVPTDGSQTATNVTTGTRPNWGRAAGGGAGSPTPTPAANVAPSFSQCPAALAIPAFGGPATATVMASDGNAGDTVSLTKTAGPGTLTSTGTNPVTGTLSASATIVDWIGDFLSPIPDVSISASDGQASATCVMAVDVVLAAGSSF